MIEPWPLELAQILREQPCVMVTVAGIKGSAPRALGARMLVTGQSFKGSIGGGNLEKIALETARELLRSGAGQVQFSDRFGLGPALNQCCGGAVTLLYEYCQAADAPWLESLLRALSTNGRALLLTAVDTPNVSKRLIDGAGGADVPAEARGALDEPPSMAGETRVVETASGPYLLECLEQAKLELYLFGAGHVGKAVVRALAPLPFRIHWVDQRAAEFPDVEQAGVIRHVTADPVAEVASSGEDCLFLVMTHSHELDEDICHAVLSRGNFTWLGLIGSETKRLRFRHRLEQRGIPAEQLDRLVCPVGHAGVKGKRPATIAVAVAAQLLSEQVPDGWK